MWWIEENARKSHLMRKEFILEHIRNGTWDPHDRRINKPPELHVRIFQLFESTFDSCVG